jgi:predicted RNA-binding Zn-ribbon protein involved in translation (DUF1610 family)
MSDRNVRTFRLALTSGMTSRDSREASFCFVQSKHSTSAESRSSLTAAEYGTLQNAYDYFNGGLFAASLPQVLITLQRHRGAQGYFSSDRFKRRDDARQHVHELALNPDTFPGRSDEEILSTLVHEQVHVWQKEFGHSGRGRYHNREWASKMHSIGLMPSTTGKPGGAVTGDRVSHYILEGGPFQAICGTFLERCRLVCESAVERDSSSGLAGIGITKTQTRTKFTCPNCGLNAWAKPDALIDCHRCSEEARETVLMGANPSMVGNTE